VVLKFWNIGLNAKVEKVSLDELYDWIDNHQKELGL
jgi:hypothetical protein